MKQKIFLLLSALLITTLQLSADIDEGVIGSENINDVSMDRGPFRLELDFDSVGSARIKDDDFDDDHVQFSQYDAVLGIAVGFIPHCIEVYSVAFGYTKTHLGWDNNPYFDQQDFYQASFAFRFFSMRMKDWRWQGQFAANINAQHWDFNHYLDFDITVWGRYECCDDVGIHLGFTAQTGMRIDRIYPIIGVEWKISECWDLNLVFPVNISLVYKHNTYFSSELAMRFFDIRQRVDKNEPLSQGLFAYRNAGVEYGFNYVWDPKIEANVHVGYTLGGDLRISNKHNDFPKHFHLEPSVYFGGEVVLSF